LLLTHQGQLILTQSSDTLNPAQQRRQAQSQESAATQSVLGLTHGAGETGFFLRKEALQSADKVKNPVSLVGVNKSCQTNSILSFPSTKIPKKIPR
jgi:hypothetical protein